ncbi:hypothetical protein GCM10010264_10550 [Streptomyces globisporus]|nr:hypothetical protein GCM10010264_10550 [Streptomyces globisporus]
MGGNEWGRRVSGGMVVRMPTKKYTVTLPEKPAEETLAEVGPGGLSAYATRVVERRREQDRPGELVAPVGGPGRE